MPHATHELWIDSRSMLRMYLHARELALRVTSGNPGQAITFNQFASSIVFLEGVRPKENLTRLKLSIVDRYIALGHTLTEAERVEIEAEKAAWEELRRKVRQELEQFYTDIGATEMSRMSDEGWDRLLNLLYEL